MATERSGRGNLNTLIAVAALIATIATLVVQVLQGQAIQRELTGYVVSSDELTSPASVPDLSAEYAYLGHKVDRLWKVTIDFINSGNHTIVGEGQQKDLVSDGILLAFPEGTDIINIEEEMSGLPSSAAKEGASQFRLRFPQWRKQERLRLSFYVASSRPLPSPLMPTALSRDVIDGEVLVRDARDPAATQRQAVGNSLTDQIRQMVTPLGRISVLAAAAILILMAIYGWIEAIRVSRWKKENITQLREYLATLNEVSPEQLKAYVTRPDRLPPHLWNDFPGAQLKVRNALYPGTVSAAIFSVMLLIMAVSMTSFAW